MRWLLLCSCLLLISTSFARLADEDLDPSTVAFVCSFELNNCAFTFQSDDSSSYSWKVGPGFLGTPWTLTGPMVDHTFLSPQGLFAYTDSTSGDSGSKTRITSPVMSCTGDQCCLEFYYHMFGQGMGSLNIVTTQTGFGDSTLATIGGESSGSQWRRFRGTISPLGNTFQFYLEAVRSYAPSVIAIDDIAIYQEGCPSEQNTKVHSLPFTCNFTADMCDMYSSKVDGDFSWSFQNGSTLSPNSGPIYDPYGLTTFFVYAESAARSRERAVLWTPPLDVSQLTTSQCLEVSFYFHMYGRTMGFLNVRMVTGDTSTLLYTRSGNSGNRWIGGYARAYVAGLPANTKTVQFYFEADVVTSPASNMALQGISIRPITCSNTTCETATMPQNAMTSAQNNITFALLPGNSSQDCINSCMTSSDCLAVTYNYGFVNNCTHFLSTSFALVNNVPNAITVTKTCLGMSMCSVLQSGEYQSDGTYLFDYKPLGYPNKTLSSGTATATERLCHIACSSRYDCVAVSYWSPYNGTCEIYTAKNATIIGGVVMKQQAARRRTALPFNCPSSGPTQCGLPPQMPFLGTPTFSDLTVNSTATYGCNETFSSFITGNGTSICNANLTWSNPGVCEFEGVCSAGLSMIGMERGPVVTGSLAYVFTTGKFPCSGVLSRWQAFVRNVDIPVYFDIWAPTAVNNAFRLVSTQKIIPKIRGVQYFTPSAPTRIFPGYMIGYHYESNAIPSDTLVIPHADDSDPYPWNKGQLLDTSQAFYTHANMTVGAVLTFLSSAKASRIPALRAFLINTTSCSTPPSTPGGQVVARTEGNSVGSIATFQCRSNYIMVGDSTSTCLADGTWSTAPSCNYQGQASGCGTPPPVPSGTPVYTSTAVGATLTYTCSQGFAGGVVTSAVCQPDQTWGPDIPTCDLTETCANGPAIVDSSSLSQPSSLWLVILNSTFPCTGRLRRWTYWSQQGGVIVYFGVFVLNPDSTWTLLDYTNVTTLGTNYLETVDIPDTKVFNVTAGQYIGFFYPNPNAAGALGALPVGTTANLGPYATTDLVGAWVYPYGSSDIFASRTFKITATSFNSNYRVYPLRASVTVPPAQCNPPTPPSNGVVHFTALTDGATATYSCNTGYTIVGNNSVMTCNSLGYWTPTPPTCEAIDLCSTGTASTTSGSLNSTNLRIFSSQMAFTCSGELRRWKFYANAANVKVHLGIWRKPEDASNTLKWQLVGYNDYTAPAVGSVVYDVPYSQRILVKPGDVVGVHYDSPFFGPNNSVITLTQSSGYTGYEMAIGDGDIANKTVTFASEVTSDFYAPNLYASVVTSTGCAPPPMPVNGRVYRTNSTAATYGCLAGYTMIGSATTTCSIAGKWPPAPLCVGRGGCSAGLSTLGNTSIPFSAMSGMLHVFTTMKFPCSGKVIGWSFISTSYDHVVYLSAWRSIGNGFYNIIGYNKIWAAQVGYNYIAVPTNQQFNVTTGDMVGIFYQTPQMPTELLVVPYAGSFEKLRGFVTQLDSGFMASYGLKQFETMANSTVYLGVKMQIRWRTPQVQATIQS